jgi:hypothetical protein
VRTDPRLDRLRNLATRPEHQAEVAARQRGAAGQPCSPASTVTAVPGALSGSADRQDVPPVMLYGTSARGYLFSLGAPILRRGKEGTDRMRSTRPDCSEDASTELLRALHQPASGAILSATEAPPWHA